MAKRQVEQVAYVQSVSYIIIHRIIKKQNETPRLQYRDALNKVDDKTIALLNVVYEAYRKKTKKSYGIFDTGIGLGDFKILFDSGIDHPDAFIVFSKDAMTLYKNRIEGVNLAVGGYVLFASFFTSSGQYMAVVVLTDHQRFGIDESNMEVTGLAAVDTGKLRMGCVINMAEYHSAQKNEEEKRYLSFVASSEDASLYFKKFIGCTELTDARKDTIKLKTIMANYRKEKNIADEDWWAKTDALVTYAYQKISNTEPVTLEEISSFLSPADDREEFVNYVRDLQEDSGLSDDLMLDRKSLSSLIRKTYRGKGFQITFERKLLKEGIVQLDKNARNVTFHNMPDEFFADIE